MMASAKRIQTVASQKRCIVNTFIHLSFGVDAYHARGAKSKAKSVKRILTVATLV